MLTIIIFTNNIIAQLCTYYQSRFKFYSQIKDDNRQYLSGIIYFKNRADYENFEENEEKINSILNRELPLTENIYFLKYIFKESGSVSYRQLKYDNRKTDE